MILQGLSLMVVCERVNVWSEASRPQVSSLVTVDTMSMPKFVPQSVETAVFIINRLQTSLGDTLLGVCVCESFSE